MVDAATKRFSDRRRAHLQNNMRLPASNNPSSVVQAPPHFAWKWLTGNVVLIGLFSQRGVLSHSDLSRSD
jgi:hypothetical protein